MKDSTWQSIINAEFIRSLTWALIHSLWIGAAVVVITVPGLIITRRSSSMIRYRMLIYIFLLFLVSTGMAGFLSFRHTADKIPLASFDTNVSYSITDLPIDSAHNWYGMIVRFVDNWSVLMVSVWAIFLMLRIYMLWRNVDEVRRLKLTAVSMPIDRWQEILTKFTNRFAVTTKVALLESVKVSVPVTLGHLRPVIIVPVGFFLQLPYTQVEAILFHELAHIYRKDYLINLLQHTVDSVFFFNPGLLWLSGLIREQREICCDDIVIANTANKTEYLKGLLAFGSRQNARRLSPVLLGIKSSPLARRLSRMIENRNQSIGLLPRTIGLVTFAVLLLAGSLISMQKAPNGKVVMHLQKPVLHPGTQPTIQTPANPIATYKKNVNLPKSKHEQSTLPEINDEKNEPVPNDTAFHLASIRFEKSNEDMANRVMTVKDDEGNIYCVQISRNELVALSINGTIISGDQLSAHLPLLARIDEAYKKKQVQKALALAQGKFETPVKL